MISSASALNHVHEPGRPRLLADCGEVDDHGHISASEPRMTPDEFADAEHVSAIERAGSSINTRRPSIVIVLSAVSQGTYWASTDAEHDKSGRARALPALIATQVGIAPRAPVLPPWSSHQEHPHLAHLWQRTRMSRIVGRYPNGSWQEDACPTHSGALDRPGAHHESNPATEIRSPPAPARDVADGDKPAVVEAVNMIRSKAHEFMRTTPRGRGELAV